MRVASWVLRGPLLLLLLGSVVFAYAQELPPDTASTTPATLEETPPPADEPLIQLAEAAPTSIVYVYDTSVSYPKRFPSSGDLQSALKDGDVFTITASAYSYGDTGYQQIDTVTADLSELGLGLAVPLSPQGQANQPLRYYFSAIDLILPPGVASGTKQLPITITDENGVQAIVTISILVDTVSPTLALSATVAPNTPLKPSYPLYWSGSMDGTGTPLRIYRIWQEQLAEDGTTVLSTQVLGPQNGDMTTFRDVVDGPLTNVPYYITDIGRSGMFTDGTAYLRFTFIAADGAGNQVTTASSLYPIHWDLLPTGTATTSPYTIVHDFPWAAWGDPSRWAGMNTPFRRRLSLYPLVGVSNAETGEWGTVGADFMNWYDQTQTRTFNRLEAYLGIGGVAGLARHPATSGNLYIKIFEANENGDRLSLLATSDALPASALVQLANPEDCTGYGFSFNPFTSGCIANFSFAQAVTLSVGVRYTFELTGEGIVTTPVSTNGTYYLPDLMMVGASRYSPPLWGLDGIQRGVNPNTGAVYMRLLDTGVVTPTTGASSVLFIPGIKGSRLYKPDYRGGTDQLWEPNLFGEDVQDLYMNPDGTSVRHDIYTKRRDLIRSAPGMGDIYGSLLDDFEELKDAEKIRDWDAVAYDWRLSIDEILANGHEMPDGRIYYSGDLAGTSTPYILQQLRHMADTSATGRATIVVHSNGGLVIKRLMQILGPEESARLIDKVIFVASPQAGAPQAIAAAMHGYKEELVGGALLTNSTARTFASTTPMTYNLMPSYSYFTQVDDPVVAFDASLPEWIARYGATIHSQERLDAFLSGTYGRVDAKDDSLNDPIQLSASLKSAANGLHDDVDSWTAPPGVEIVQIAGWGIPTTMKGITYKQEGAKLGFEIDTTVDGDGIVPVPSALWVNGTTTSNYWFDLGKFNSDHELLGIANAFPRKHGNMFDVDFLRKFVSDHITGSVEPISAYPYLTETAPLQEGNRLRFSLHSPLTLNFYDDYGNHTGVSTTTGLIEEQIPGSYYAEVGDVKYVYTDTDTPARIYMDGYDTGTFTFKAEEFFGDTLVASTTFKDIPTTPDTAVELDTGADITEMSPMKVDKNGDGVVDATLVPKLNGVVTIQEDVTPPVTTADMTGTTGANGWFTSTTTVTLNATDSDSGVAKTSYALNGGAWQEYATTSPIIVGSNGTTTLQFYSIDVAGNSEATSTQTVLLDRVPPEALITLDISKRLLVSSRIDNLSGTSTPATIPTSAMSTTVTDSAGHTIKLAYSKNEQKSDRASLTTSSISYDSGFLISATSTARFYWKNGTLPTKPILFIAHVRAGNTSLIALYSSLTKKTLIMSAIAKDDAADLSTLATNLLLLPRPILKQFNGLVIPYLVTKEGKIKIGY